MSKSPAAAKRQRQNKARRRKDNLEAIVADGQTKEWKKLTEYHYQRSYRGKLLNWWPSSCKAQILGDVFRVDSEKEIYGIFDTLLGSVDK